MFIFQLCGQIFMILSLAIFSQEIDYEHNGTVSVNYQKYLKAGKFIVDTPEANILFLFSNFMYIFTLLNSTISYPWREPFYKNKIFLIILAFVLPYTVLMVVVPGARLSIFYISYMTSTSLNFFILGMAFIIGLLMYLVQRCIIEPLEEKCNGEE